MVFNSSIFENVSPIQPSKQLPTPETPPLTPPQQRQRPLHPLPTPPHSNDQLLHPNNSHTNPSPHGHELATNNDTTHATATTNSMAGCSGSSSARPVLLKEYTGTHRQLHQGWGPHIGARMETVHNQKIAAMEIVNHLNASVQQPPQAQGYYQLAQVQEVHTTCSGDTTRQYTPIKQLVALITGNRRGIPAREPGNRAGCRTNIAIVPLEPCRGRHHLNEPKSAGTKHP